MKPVIDGWREGLLNVADIDAWIGFYLETGDWEVLYSGKLAPASAEFIGLPANGVTREVLIGHPGNAYGRVRLLSMPDAESYQPIRSHDEPCALGGWFDLNARVDDMGDRFAQVQAMGWGSVCDPVQYSFGPLEVREWLARGPDGITWALIERIRPPLDAADRPGKLGPHFNATQFVPDFTAARHFYEDILGFAPVVHVDDQPVSPESGANVLGLSGDEAGRQHWNVVMAKAPGAMGGGVEYVSLPGKAVSDFSALTDPPRRGILSLRFPVGDIAALHSYLLGERVAIVEPPREVLIPPDGTVIMMTVRGPAGARLDFFQPN